MDTEELKAKIYKLRHETGAGVMDCKKVIMDYPDATDEELKFYVGYYSWLRTFMDGDRSIEAYKKRIGV